MATTVLKRNSFFSEEPGTLTVSKRSVDEVIRINNRLEELEEKVIQSKQMTLLKDVVSPSSAIGNKLKTSVGTKEFITHLENEAFGNDKEGQEGIEYNSIYLVDIPGSLHGEKYELVYLKPKTPVNPETYTPRDFPLTITYTKNVQVIPDGSDVSHTETATTTIKINGPTGYPNNYEIVSDDTEHPASILYVGYGSQTPRTVDLCDGVFRIYFEYDGTTIGELKSQIVGPEHLYSVSNVKWVAPVEKPIGKWTLLGSTSVSDEEIAKMELDIGNNEARIFQLSNLVQTTYATKAELQAVDDKKVDITTYESDKAELEAEIARKAYITDVAAISTDLSNAIIAERNRATQVETDLNTHKANKTDVANEFQRVDGDISELSGYIDHITDDVIPTLQTKEDAKKELSTVVVDNKEYTGGLTFDQNQFVKYEMVPSVGFDGDIPPLPVEISIKDKVFDVYGSATSALTSAKEYTDAQIDTVVTSLSDYCTLSKTRELSTLLNNKVLSVGNDLIVECVRAQRADTEFNYAIDQISSQIIPTLETKENAAIISSDVLSSAKAYVNGQIDAIVNGAPELFDTLKEIADELSSMGEDGAKGLIIDVSNLKTWTQNDKDYNSQDIVNDLDELRSKQIKKIESIEDLSEIQGIGFGSDVLSYAVPYVIDGFNIVPSVGKLEGTIYGVCKGVEYSILTGNTLTSEPEEYCTFISDSDYKTTIRIDVPDGNPAFFRIAKKNPEDKRFSVLFDVKKDTRVNINSENLVTNKAIATEMKKYVPLTGGHMSGELEVAIDSRLEKELTTATYSSKYIKKEYNNLSAGLTSTIQLNYPTDEGHFELSSGDAYGEEARTFATREWATEKFRTQDQCLEEFVTINDNSALSDIVSADHITLNQFTTTASNLSNEIIPTLQTKAEAEEQLSTIALNGLLATGGLFLNENQFHISEVGNALSIAIDETDFEEDIRIAAETALNSAKSYTNEKIGEVQTVITDNYGTINTKLNTVNDQLNELMTIVDSKATSLEVAQLNEKFDDKADLSAVYTKTEADERFLQEHQDISGKADKTSVYTKEEIDVLLLNEQQNLSNYISKQMLKDQLSSDLSALKEFDYDDPTEMTLSVLIHNVGVLQNTFTNLIQSI